MDDIRLQKLNKELEVLNGEIKKYEDIINPLYKRKKEIMDELKTDNLNNLDFSFTSGFKFIGKHDALYLYINKKDETYYTNPLINLKGNPYGLTISKKDLLRKKRQLKELGYRHIS